MNENTPLIYQKIIAVMSEINHIGKNQKNQAQGFKFRGIDDLYNSFHGLFAKHGIFTVPSVENKTSEERQNAKGTVIRFVTLDMTYKFFAEDGSFIEAKIAGEAMDSGDKATNKAMAIAHKYALLQVFCVPTEEQIDPDFDTHELKTQETILPKDWENLTVHCGKETAGKEVMELDMEFIEYFAGVKPYKGSTFSAKTQKDKVLAVCCKKALDVIRKNEEALG